MSAIVWRLEVLRSTLIGKTPFITKETAHSAHQVYYYSTEKIRSLGFQFLPLSKSIADTSKILLSEKLK